MVQLSRPFQAIVAALALFVLVWFVALHRPGSTSTGSGSSSGSSGAQSASRATTHPAAGSHTATVARSTGASHTKAAAAQSATHTGGHTETTGHAGAATVHHGGAAARKQHAASQAHSTAAHSGASPAHKVSPAAATGTSSHATGTSHASSSVRHAGTSAGDPGRSTAPITDAAANAIRSEVLQAIVAGDLKHGRVVLLLFWNPGSSNDVAVHQQVAIVAHKLGRSVAAFAARASQVGLFGSITRDVQVYQTPTLLIVNPKRQVTTVTGLTDAYALEQTIREARG